MQESGLTRKRVMRFDDSHRPNLLVMLGYLRLQLRFLIPLAAAMVLAAYVALPLIDKVTLRWFTRDIGARGALVANALHDSTVDALGSRDARRLELLFDRTA